MKSRKRERKRQRETVCRWGGRSVWVHHAWVLFKVKAGNHVNETAMEINDKTDML